MLELSFEIKDNLYLTDTGIQKKSEIEFEGVNIISG